jgi:uncharacterized protein (TIGR02466 family)
MTSNGERSVEEALAQALTQHRGGNIDAAREIYQAVLARQPEQPDALHLLGVIAHQRGDHRGAAELIDRAIAQRDDQADYHANLGRVLQVQEDYAGAAAAYQRAVALDPDQVLYRCSLGAALQGCGELERAMDLYREALARQPGLATAHFNLATAHKQQGALEQAAASFRRAVELEPGTIEFRANLADVLLQQGDAQAALESCNECLAQAPGNRLALAYKAVALQECGARDELSQLLNLERLLYPVIVDPGPGFAGLAEFNAALAAHVRAHPSLREGPSLQATRHGKHTGELLMEPKGPIADLERLLQRTVADYIKTLGIVAPEHPYVANMPRQFRLAVWAVVMQSQGHQLPHIHGDGYISGVYYPELPDVVGADAPQKEGWIEFGRPPADFHCKQPPETRLIKPEPGLLVLFPSYLYHCTIPFESDQERISIAFDAMPA